MKTVVSMIALLRKKVLLECQSSADARQDVSRSSYL